MQNLNPPTPFSLSLFLFPFPISMSREFTIHTLYIHMYIYLYKRTPRNTIPPIIATCGQVVTLRSRWIFKRVLLPLHVPSLSSSFHPSMSRYIRFFEEVPGSLLHPRTSDMYKREARRPALGEIPSKLVDPLSPSPSTTLRPMFSLRSLKRQYPLEYVSTLSLSPAPFLRVPQPLVSLRLPSYFFLNPGFWLRYYKNIHPPLGTHVAAPTTQRTFLGAATYLKASFLILLRGYVLVSTHHRVRHWSWTRKNVSHIFYYGWASSEMSRLHFFRQYYSIFFDTLYIHFVLCLLCIHTYLYLCIILRASPVRRYIDRLLHYISEPMYEERDRVYKMQITKIMFIRCYQGAVLPI